jgi:D-beta-D-heptose 7-phosphate kinase/D-beta-D-heptose 1-phosphate adenosyltransferase
MKPDASRASGTRESVDRAGGSAADVLRRCVAHIDRFDTLDVLVVGDVMIDEDLVGDVERVSPEAPVPVVGVERELRTLGGAGNVVRNLVGLGARCRFCTVVGDDDDGRRVIDLLKELGVETAGVVVDPNRRTTRKTRVVARGQQMIRVDREDLHAIDGAVRSAFETCVRAAAPGADGVAFVDYGKGVLAPEPARALVALAGELGLPAAVDPKQHLDAFAGVRLVKPNFAEARMLVAGARMPTGEPRHEIGYGAVERGVFEAAAAEGPHTGAFDPVLLAHGLARALAARLPGADVALTLGSKGMVVFETGAEPITVPTAALAVYDVQGAGDTSFAALWLARLAGASVIDAARIANAASGVAVSKVGTATANRHELSARLPDVVAAAD